MALQIITGSQIQLAATMSLLQQQGWLLLGGITVTGSTYVALMTRGDGIANYSTTMPLSQSVSPESYANPTGSGIWQNVFPPQSTGSNTLLGINTNPNIVTALRGWTIGPGGHKTGSYYYNTY